MARSSRFLQPVLPDFLQFQAAYRARRRQNRARHRREHLDRCRLAGWALLRNQKQLLVAQTAVLDLRNRSLSRGGESNPVEPPLEVNRRVKHLTVYLPLGSAEGPYEMRITTTTGGAVFATTGVASLKDGVTSIQAVVDLSLRPPDNTFSRSGGRIWPGIRIHSCCDDSDSETGI